MCPEPLGHVGGGRVLERTTRRPRASRPSDETRFERAPGEDPLGPPRIRGTSAIAGALTIAPWRSPAAFGRVGSTRESRAEGCRPMLAMRARCRRTGELVRLVCGTKVARSEWRAALPMERSVQDRFIHTGALVAGRYRLLRGLGAGASGLVYLARDVVDGADVAVKVLRDASQGRTNLRERFEREAEALRRVTSPFVVRTLDFGLDNAGLQFLVMEYLDGMNAGTLVARDGPFRGPRLYALADQIFCGIAAMHRAGVVHRDVKPHNVVIVQGVDGGESAKLIDLGLAKPLRGKYKTLTALATAIGTPAFMSPEQVTGEATIDVRTDVYSAAATFVALATGRTLYDDRGHAILGAVVERRRLPVHRVAVDLPPPTCAVLERALSYEPAARYESILAFSSALAASLPGSPPSSITLQMLDDADTLPESRRETVRMNAVKWPNSNR